MRVQRWIFLASTVLAGCAPTARPVTAPRRGIDAEFEAARQAVRHQTAADVLPLRALTATRDGTVRVVIFTTWDGYRQALDSGDGRLTLGTEVWVSAAGEVRDSCARYPRERVVEETARLLGLLPRDTVNRTFVEVAAPLDSIFRPTPDPDPTGAMACPLDAVARACEVDALPESHPMRAFMTRQRASEYPFTGLGYTYNWRRGAPRYGASEFVVRKGTPVQVLSVSRPSDYCTAA